MHVLAIDIGSYSVKYISTFVDRRRIGHVDMSEIIVRDYLNDHEGMSFLEAQAGIVHEILETVARPDTRVLFQANNEMMTTRFLTLPVKSKKKAELMLPFQLEEDIPYALSEIHFAYRMEAQKNQFLAIAELARSTAFEEYFNTFRDKHALPSLLTTEASVVENYFNQTPIAGPFCLLDIGHKTTKAYFFLNSRLLVTHLSYVGGQHINEMIAQTYQIDPDEAIFYKHQNAFMLTSNQFEEVEPAQREFAHAMDRVLSPLVSDFLRWKIGFKVNFGLPLGNVFICGGSSNIKNIANYLTEKWDTKVALLETFDKVEGDKVDLNPKNKSKFALANMMAVAFRKKNRFINLLGGRFAQASTTELPLHSFAFIALRVSTVAALLAISLLVERMFIQRDIAFVNAKITSVMKNDTLQISGRERRAITTNPKPVYDSLVKRQRGVKQEISTLQSAIEIQSLAPLVTISQIASNSEATLTHFSSNETGEVKATFSAENIEELNKVKDSFERSSLSDVVAELNTEKLTLHITAGK
ncbi:MAG TPA: pilus assembly protein PilM [Bacteriovoracaceae bacterium]|nr:pilus assembly protein PilM [Bacteriovoracaceae bacterium]